MLAQGGVGGNIVSGLVSAVDSANSRYSNFRLNSRASGDGRGLENVIYKAALSNKTIKSRNAL